MKEENARLHQREEENETLERFVESLVETVNLNAWEYGNTGNMLYN